MFNNAINGPRDKHLFSQWSPITKNISFLFKNQLQMWDIAMFANGTIGGSGYNFDITFFNESEMVDDPCTSPYGLHLICMTDFENDSKTRIDNGIIVTDKWILTSTTACLNIYTNPWNNYFVHAGTHNLTKFENGSVIKNYHMYSKENQDQDRGCNQNDDYCLIELETPLVISESIQAIGFQHFATTASTAIPTDFTTSWDSTWNPNLTTITSTVFTSTTTTTTSTTTTTTTSTNSDRRKRQAVPIPPFPTNIVGMPTIPTTTTTTTKGAPEVPSTKPSFDVPKCWIAAWSDNNLRTFKVDIATTSYCYQYYPSEYIPFRKHKLSNEQKAESRKRQKDDKRSRDRKINSKIHSSEHIIDDIMNPQGLNYYGERNHICLDNLRNVSSVYYSNIIYYYTP